MPHFNASKRSSVRLIPPDEWAPCRSCGHETPLVSDFLGTDGLVCAACRVQPPQVHSPESWLLARQEALLADLKTVESALLRLRSARRDLGVEP